MKIKTGQERSEIDINISEIVGTDGSINMLPQVKNYFSIDYKPKNNQLSLMAKGFIGLIPITTELAVDIRPKFSIKNLTKLVATAQGKFHPISFFNRLYDEKEDRPDIVYDFLVESFIHELKIIYKEGVYREYVRKIDISSIIRGKLKSNESIKHLWSHGNFNKIICEHYALSSITILNQLIKFTILFCLNNIHVDSKLSRENKNQLIFFLDFFNGIEVSKNNMYLDLAFNVIKDNKIPELRKYYVNICEICRLILTGKGINFDDVGKNLNISSFILNMDDIFEKFLLNTIQERKSDLGSNILVLDGNNEGKKKFFTPPGKSNGDAKPDIIIKDYHNVKVIADAKYKIATKDTDRYQVISHALSYGASQAFLILPSRNDFTYVERLGSVGGSFPITVHEIYLNICSDDLEKEQIKLINIIRDLIN